MKIRGNILILCYLQLAGVLLLIGFVVTSLPSAIEYNRLVEDNHAQNLKTIAMIRKDGIRDDQKEMAAQLFEALLGRANLHPKQRITVIGAAIALAVLLSLLPIALLWDRKPKSGA